MNRYPALFASLLATVPAAAAPAVQPTVRPAVQPAPQVVPQAAAEPVAESCPVAAANLFPSRSWQPPPPPPRKPEPPKAPPLPFTYLGQIEEERGIALFLGRGQRTLIVRRGEIIEGTYRVEAVTPVRATFVFLPLDQPQHLALRTRP